MALLKKLLLLSFPTIFVMPNVLATVVHLHQKLGIDTNDDIVQQTVEISKKEVCFPASI